MKKLIIVFLSLWLITTARAQNQKISEMATYIGNPSGGWVPVVIAGTNRKVDANYFGFNKVDSFDVKQGSTYDTLWAYKNGNKAFFKLTRAGGGSIPDSLLNSTLTDGGVAYRVLSKPNDSTALIKDIDTSRYIKLDSTNLKITPRLDIPALKADGRFKIDSLPNVQITSLTNGQVLKWNSTTSKWENAADNNSGGGSGDTANLIFDTIPAGGSPTAVFQVGNILRTRAHGDSGRISWTVNGQGKIVAVFNESGLGGSSSFFLPGGNTFTQDTSFGSTSNHDLILKTNNTIRARYTKDGKFFWNADADALGWNYYINDTARIRAIKLVGGSTSTTSARNALLSIAGANTSSTDYLLNAENSTGQVVLRLSNSGAVSLPTIFSAFSSTAMTFVGTTYLIRPNNVAGTTGGLNRISTSNYSTPTSGQQVAVASVEGAGVASTSGTGQWIGFWNKAIQNSTGTHTGKVIGFLHEPTITSLVGDDISFESRTGRTLFRSLSQNETATIQTTNTTPTTIATIPHATSASEVEIIATIRAESGSDLAIYRKLLRVKNVSGTLTILGSLQTIGSDFEDSGLSAADITATVSGTNILIQATGISGTVDWRVVFETRTF
jgi:hypothetical protein